MVIDTCICISLGTRDGSSSDDADDFSDGLGLSPLIEESQGPDDEHAAQEEPDVNAHSSEPPAEHSEQPSGSHCTRILRTIQRSGSDRESHQVLTKEKA